MANFSKPQNMMTAVFALISLLQFTVAFQHGSHHNHLGSADHVVRAQLDVVADELSKRQNSGYVAITGVNNGQAAPRLEIRTLMQNADQWNLYLLGMERFQAKDKNDVLSYYQVVGVHGRPYVSWGNFPTPLLHQAGFCPHAQTLFGTWHRPYLALFEQALYQSIQEVIATFPTSQQQRWKNAAATFRMPYWDWAMDPGTNQPTVPTSIREQTVTVTKPSGRVTIANPLYAYSWGSSLPTEMGGGPWNSWPATLRRPVANPTRNNNNEMNARFASVRVSLRDRLFALFSSKASWGLASTSQIGVRTDLSGSGVDSFESVHDIIHNTAGGESGGHMYYLDLSSFDPIFWLHHTNIDRLLSMHQLITPNTWVANGNINRNMAQWNQGEAKNSNSPLKPFTKNTNGDYFTSNDIKDTRVLGYYYPETSQGTYSQVAQAVSKLYGAGVRSMSKRHDTDETTGQYLGRPFEEGDYHTVLSIIADKFAMDGSYTVHAFIRDDEVDSTDSNSTYSTVSKSSYSKGSNSTIVPTYGNSTVTAPYPTTANTTLQYQYASGDSEADYDPSTDITQNPNYVGAYGVLGGTMAGTGGAVMTEGNLPLTSCLQGKQKNGKLASLKPEHVEPYLAKNLHYVVIGPNGEMDPASIPNFHVSVKCTKVTPATSSGDLPDLSAPFEKLEGATKHLPAGQPFTYTPQPVDIAPPAGDAEYEEPAHYGSDSGSKPSQTSASSKPTQTSGSSKPTASGKPSDSYESNDSDNAEYDAATPSQTGGNGKPVASGSPSTGYPSTGSPSNSYESSGNDDAEYDVSMPSQVGSSGKPAASGYPSSGYPSTSNPSTGYPSSGNPSTGYPSSGNPSAGYPSNAHPSNGYASTPSSNQESQCEVKQVIHYVNPAGEFLYAEM